MGAATTIALVLLGIAVLGCLLRVMTGPSTPDRVIALDAATLCSMGIMVIIAIKYNSDFFLDVALIVAVLSFIGTLSVAKFLMKGRIID